MSTQPTLTGKYHNKNKDFSWIPPHCPDDKHDLIKHTCELYKNTKVGRSDSWKWQNAQTGQTCEIKIWTNDNTGFFADSSNNPVNYEVIYH